MLSTFPETVGTPGLVRGATAGVDSNEKALGPAIFFAATLKVYGVPFVRVVTTNCVTSEGVCVIGAHTDGLGGHDWMS